MARSVHLTRAGWTIAATVAVLSAIGLACIYATERGADSPGNTNKQVIFLAGSLVAAAVIVRVGFQRIHRHAYLIFGLSLAALIPLTAARVFHFDFGGLIPDIRGAHRWIRLPGFQLQPSEFMKVGLLLALAWYLRYKKNCRRLSGLLVPFAFSAVPLVLILLEPDLGTALLIMPVVFAVLYLAGARVGHLALIAGLGAALAPLAWTRMEPYQRMRVVAVLLQSDALRRDVQDRPERYGFLHPDSSILRREARGWTRSSGLQVVRSKAALGSGGLFGQGWGHGTYVEYSFLPDRHNDFVFALIGHQFGLVGCVAVLGCYVVFCGAGMQIARQTTEPVGRLLASGVVVLIATQVLINVGMCVGLMPVTGMTLPFVSYGGSSLLANFIAAGLLVSVGRHRPFLLAPKPFEYSRTPLSFPPRTDESYPVTP